MRLWAKLEDRNPTGFHQGPGRAGDGARGRGRRPADAGLHDPGADVGQHRHLAGHGGQAARLRPGVRDAREHLDRAAPTAGDVRRPHHLLARGRRLEPGRRHREAARRAVPGLGDALPVRQPGQRPGALRGHRPGDPARPADDHPLRRRAGHHRHVDGRGPLPAREGPGRLDHRRRAALRRAGLRPAQHRRGLRAGALRRLGAHLAVLGHVLRRAAAHPRPDRARGDLRRHLDRRDPARGAVDRRTSRRSRRAGRRRVRRRRRRLEVPVHRRLRRARCSRPPSSSRASSGRNARSGVFPKSERTAPTSPARRAPRDHGLGEGEARPARRGGGDRRAVRRRGAGCRRGGGRVRPARRVHPSSPWATGSSC